MDTDDATKISIALDEADSPAELHPLSINTLVKRINWLGHRVEELYLRHRASEEQKRKFQSLFEQEQARAEFWKNAHNELSIKINKIKDITEHSNG